MGATSSYVATNGDQKAALNGAFTGAAFNVVGSYFSFLSQGKELTNGMMAAKIAANGVVGGLSSVSQGGSFESGFLSAGLSQSAAQFGVYESLGAVETAQGWGVAYNAGVAAVIGETVSTLSGGSLEDAALNAAMGRLFNDLAHPGIIATIPELSLIGKAVGDFFALPARAATYIGQAFVGAASTTAVAAVGVLYSESTGAGADRYPAGSKHSPDFVVSPDGTAFPVPAGAEGPVPVINAAGNQTGSAFVGGKGGANGQVRDIRIMDPTPARGNSPAYPNGYIKYQNGAKPKPQGVDPYTGKTLPNSESHFPIN